eukprot:939956-Rhodomonas_salina.3
MACQGSSPTQVPTLGNAFLLGCGNLCIALLHTRAASPATFSDPIRSLEICDRLLVTRDTASAAVLPRVLALVLEPHPPPLHAISCLLGRNGARKLALAPTTHPRQHPTLRTHAFVDRGADRKALSAALCQRCDQHVQLLAHSPHLSFDVVDLRRQRVLHLGSESAVGSVGGQGSFGGSSAHAVSAQVREAGAGTDVVVPVRAHVAAIVARTGRQLRQVLRMRVGSSASRDVARGYAWGRDVTGNAGGRCREQPCGRAAGKRGVVGIDVVVVLHVHVVLVRAAAAGRPQRFRPRHLQPNQVLQVLLARTRTPSSDLRFFVIEPGGEQKGQGTVPLSSWLRPALASVGRHLRQEGSRVNKDRLATTHHGRAALSVSACPRETRTRLRDAHVATCVVSVPREKGADLVDQRHPARKRQWLHPVHLLA